MEKIKHIKLIGQPLISIITPLYNAEKFISETIFSIQHQTYPNWEHIMVDDASTDGSVALAETFSIKDSRIRVVKNKSNQGAAICRNQATELAKGDYIAFLDADDLWHPEKLDKQLQFMMENNCDVSFTNYLHIDEEGNSLQKRIKALKTLSYKKQRANNYIGNLTGMYHASSIGKIKAPNIRKRQDWAVWLEAIKISGKPALGIQEDLAFYRVRSGSISADKLNLVKYNFRFYHEYLGYSKLKSLYYLFRFFWEYFFVRPTQIETL